MASTREIRRRIRSVKNIAQVTKAMEAVSAAKMRKAQSQVLATRPYAQQAREVLSYIARLPNIENELNPLIQSRPVKRTGILLITADRGLAGGFNANVIRRAAAFMRERRRAGVEVEVVTVGRKGRDWLLRYDPVVRAEFTGMPDSPTSYDIGPIARVLIDDFTQGHFDEVVMVYTDFVNTLRQEPVVQKLLPIEPAEPSVTMAPEYIFEPSPEAVLSRVLYGFTEVQILQALYESIASEHSARMVAMRNATDAANELIDTLTLTYNKARQEGITSELMDIIGGAVALERA
ncbi:ATP synthase F1 subunit gamma [Litorilinea aerophila]|uniref:ATP synthase gamma chain n=1 Tax=Litorilinea aerophila TaxID=1204385 RepID=A0A540VIP5_9CHLR|nr:ATP synthase F1 subunit gamma [Litorilinea aerophila]MCC9075868.1 ATP synthase F1 subunit gamma [Litorilinea aerophila]GIV77201.1 MAG: ATP synthase gamma chain [Litorilinea sp.]